MSQAINHAIAARSPNPRSSTESKLVHLSIVTWQMIVLLQVECKKTHPTIPTKLDLARRAITNLRFHGLTTPNEEFCRRAPAEIVWEIVALRFGKKTRQADLLADEVQSDAAAYYLKHLHRVLNRIPSTNQTDQTARLCRASGPLVRVLAMTEADDVLNAFRSEQGHARQAIKFGRELFR